MNIQYKKASVWLLVVCCAMACALIGIGIAYAFNASTMNMYGTNLESVYQKNFYELVDNVNNTEIKMSKLLASNSNAYSSKLLTEISKNAEMASNNFSALPTSINGLEDSIKFINQVNGYTSILSKKLDEGEVLSASEKESIEKIYDSLITMKIALNNMSRDLAKGYSILDKSLSIEGDYNDFTNQISSIKPSDTDYPAMIYDGPFSDSQVTKEIKGLTGEDVTKEDAEAKLRQVFASLKKVEFIGESDGWFKTYNFLTITSNDITLYAEVTKKGGHVLTVSGQGDLANKKISLENAISVAKTFAEKNGILNMECVWDNVIGDNAFINLAPVVNNIIFYPDLVKIKVDMASGVVIGYESTSYFANHTERNIENASVGATEARGKINSKFAIKKQTLALIPIDYKEVLTYEFTCEYNGAIYYIYIDAKTSEEVNILKVIETEDGDKLL